MGYIRDRGSGPSALVDFLVGELACLWDVNWRNLRVDHNQAGNSGHVVYFAQKYLIFIILSFIDSIKYFYVSG